jgi:Gram-negative porin
MTRRIQTAFALLATAVATIGSTSPARAEIPLAQYQGWQLSTDGRVNTFLSVATGTASKGQEETGAGTADTADSNDGLHSTRIRNGFMMSILGFTGQKQVHPNFKVTTRVALWMNVTGSRTKNASAQVDPRELYEKIEGGWGSVLLGSDLALFGRGGILVDYDVAHEYGLGYPCGIKDASGGGCGMVGFGAPFPGYEPGLVYATPSLAGLQLSLGLYDPATIGHAQLDRAPLPRVEGEAKFGYKEIVRVFASGFWQVLEGTIADTSPAAMGRLKNLHTDAWGAQAGAMLGLGPIQLGGAAYQGAGFSPITYIEEGSIAGDPTGQLRKSRGAFALGSVSIHALELKIAGGAGLWHLDKTSNDSGPQNEVGAPTDPRLIKQNFGVTVGAYQTTGPVHFALEYFRAQHTWYERGVPSALDPNVTAKIEAPVQTVNFINAGATVVW